MKKDLIWNGKKWIIDYETGTIYQKAETLGLPVQGRVGNYHLKKFRDMLYFATENNFYKIVGEKVLEVSKEEYKEIRNYKTLNKKDPATLRSVSAYVISIIIDDIMSEKFNLKISTSVENSNVINNFSKKFTPEIMNQIKRLSLEIIAMLPIQVNRKTMKQQIRDIYKNIVQEEEEFFKVLIDNIYLNDKEKFDYLSEGIIKSHDLRKK